MLRIRVSVESNTTNKQISIINNYLYKYNLICDIDYISRYINPSTSYTQLFLEYEFIDKSHENLIKLLLL